jgi:hypothetical protein
MMLDQCIVAKEWMREMRVDVSTFRSNRMVGEVVFECVVIECLQISLISG